MKKLIPILTLAIATACPIAGFAQKSQNLESDPAYLGIDKVFDLKTVQPEVNVNLPRFLLLDVASGFDGGPDDPFAGTGLNIGDLIKEIKLIQVVVAEATEKNRPALEDGVRKLRAKLESGWTPIVVVPEDNVNIYARSDESGESMAGIALLIYDGDDAVIANVVGRVSIGKLVQTATKIDKFPKDILKKLMGAPIGVQAPIGKPETAPAK